MAVSTLGKFGVPTPDIFSRGGILQPKYKYRFRVRVVNFGPIAGGLELTQQVVSVDKPKISFDIVTVHSYNSRAYYMGKHEWGTINLTVRDDVTNVVARLIAHQNQKQLNHHEQTGFLAGVNYKFNTILEVMDGGNDGVLERWDLEGCALSEINPSGMDYSDSEFQTIDMTIRYDNAIQTGQFGEDLMTLFPQRSSPGFRIG